jgi:hypothetical protein
MLHGITDTLLNNGGIVRCHWHALRRRREMSENTQYSIEVDELGPSRRNWSKECESGDVSAFNCPYPYVCLHLPSRLLEIGPNWKVACCGVGAPENPCRLILPYKQALATLNRPFREAVLGTIFAS